MNTQSNFLVLSHWINEDTPTYGNASQFKRKQLSSIAKGSSANSEYWEFNNHLGTHIDFPSHFCPDGKSSHEFDPGFFFVSQVGFIELDEIPAPSAIIDVAHIEKQCASLGSDIEAILLKTGFEKFRNEEVYWSGNLGYSAELFTFFRKAFPRLRFFGFDTISLTSLMNREIGRNAHRAFLCAADPILVIEDMRLSGMTAGMIPATLTISPLMINKADGAPVTCVLRY